MTVPLSKADFERQFATAARRGAARRQQQPLATSVHYDAELGVVIELSNACVVSVPLPLLPELRGASPKDLRRVEVMGIGQAVAWPTLDQQFDVVQLLSETVAGGALMAKRGRPGGRAKSRAKAAAARANGLKGGRPRKQRNTPLAAP